MQQNMVEWRKKEDIDKLYMEFEFPEYKVQEHCSCMLHVMCFEAHVA